MTVRPFPLEKIFGSRTRVKIMTLFTTGVKRPYFVREIARTVNERLNAVRRELDILEKIGMLSSYEERRRKYYVVNEAFTIFGELASIMQKAGPGIEDVLFKHLGNVGTVQYACVSGYFTSRADAPTDLLIVGNIDQQKLEAFIKRIEDQLHREISYTPMTFNEYRYRQNFSDMFLRQLFNGAYKELINKLPSDMQPKRNARDLSTKIVRDSVAG